jgi:hypothetical protein
VKITRTVGLAAVVALALTALVSVTSASAAGFMAERYPAFFAGTQITQTELNTTVGNQKCIGLELSGQLSGANQALPLSATDGSCSLGKMKMNGCKFILHPGAAGVGSGTFDIGPMGCGPITAVTGCEIAIPSQTGLAANFSNELTGSKAQIVFHAETSALKYTELFCYKKTYTTGGLVGSWLVKGYEDAAHLKQSGVHVTASRDGLYIAGKKSEEKTSQPRFEAETYPAAVFGAQTSAFKIGTSNGNIKCTAIQYSGEALATSADLSVVPDFSGCVANGQASTVAMNSCHYAVHVANEGPPYAGSLALACSKEGDGMTVSVGFPTVECTLTFPAQTMAAVTLETVGSGVNRSVIATPTGSAIKYTGSGGSCALSGENGTLSGAFELQGFK